jgi:hypothetical protein
MTEAIPRSDIVEAVTTRIFMNGLGAPKRVISRSRQQAEHLLFHFYWFQACLEIALHNHFAVLLSCEERGRCRRGRRELRFGRLLDRHFIRRGVHGLFSFGDEGITSSLQKALSTRHTNVFASCVSAAATVALVLSAEHCATPYLNAATTCVETPENEGASLLAK